MSVKYSILCTWYYKNLLSYFKQAYATHKRLEAEERQRLYIEASEIEEKIKQNQKQLMEWVLVMLVKDEIRERQIAGQDDGEINDSSIKKGLMMVEMIDAVSIYCDVASTLGE